MGRQVPSLPSCYKHLINCVRKGYEVEHTRVNKREAHTSGSGGLANRYCYPTDDDPRAGVSCSTDTAEEKTHRANSANS